MHKNSLKKVSYPNIRTCRQGSVRKKGNIFLCLASISFIIIIVGLCIFNIFLLRVHQNYVPYRASDDADDVNAYAEVSEGKLLVHVLINKR